jgi:aryl-alcohol dehydrogenase-like predicted oxidoreductase
MEFSELGTSNRCISRLGFGCAPASGYDYGEIEVSAWITAVNAALEAGIDFFDVADVYGFGLVEELLARALGDRRHEVTIATKGGLVWDEQGRVTRDSSPRQIERAIECSLRRLRIDVIPLYQLHWPDPATPVEDTIATLGKCQKEGKIRYIGVSNFSVNLLERAAGVDHIESQQVSYNLLSREIEEDVLPWSAAQRTSVIAHTGLARGLLAGKRLIDSRFSGSDTRGRSAYFSNEGWAEKQRLLNALVQVSTNSGRSVSSVALRWILDNPRITAVLVGIKDRAQLAENLEAVDWHMEQGDRDLLTALSDACPHNSAGIPAHGSAAR